MSIQKFPLTSLHKIRKYIVYSLALPESEQEAKLGEANEMPEPESLDDLSGVFTFGGTPLAEHPPSTVQEEWFISTVNPGAPLLKLPGLSLKPDYRLVSYLFRSEGSGVGVVWAVPEALSHMSELEKALQSNMSIRSLPKPTGAIENFMDVIEGDRSHASFLIASILRRELQEFGALGDRQNWSHHRLIDQLPAGNWQWQGDPPKDWLPKVRILSDGRAAVEFFSYRDATPQSIYRHLDQYPTDSYKPVTLDKTCALLK